MRFYAALTLLALSIAACKPKASVSPSSGGGGRKQLADFFASGQTEIRSKGNFFYATFKKDYELKFDALPANGSVETAKIPYVGSWYPQVFGGTAVTQNGSNALAKYDQVFNGGEDKALKWEKDNHTVAEGSSAAGWAGHCNGFSAAAQRHAEPKNSVKRGTVTFDPKDIKALLAEVHMSAKFYFLGGNRCELINSASLPAPANRSDLLSMGDCDNVNPGTFHIAIANWIGIQKHTIILDISSKEEVWNYPHYKYETTSRTIDVPEAMRLITGKAQNTYSFNPQAVGFRSLTTKIYHSKAFNSEYMTSQVAADQRADTRTYEYVLELDKEGRIIGGEWINQSQQTHPDFLWVALEPTESDGTDKSSNPNVNAQEVIKLWAESIGADPANPPLDLLEPKMAAGWGQFPKFDVSINGIATGAVFLGSPAKVRLTRREALAGDVQVDLILDGKNVATQKAADSELVVVTMDALSPGIHTLEIRWKKGDTDADVQRVRIHAL